MDIVFAYTKDYVVDVISLFFRNMTLFFAVVSFI